MRRKMNQLLKKLPRQVFYVNVYGYMLVAAALMGVALILLSIDSLAVLDAVLFLGVVAVVIGAWGYFRPRFVKRLSPNADLLLAEIQMQGRYALLSLESEYCPLCMTTGHRADQLRHMDNLTVYRLSIHSEPGRTLYLRLNGRATPTYYLISPDGDVLEEWPFVLPVDHLRNQMTQGGATA